MTEKRWLVFAIGCIECGVKSSVIGTYATKQVADEVAFLCSGNQGLQEGGHTEFEVFDMSADQPEQNTCLWTPMDDDAMPGTYNTACGEAWSFTEGGIKENSVRFCHSCGGKVIEDEQKEPTL